MACTRSDFFRNPLSSKNTLFLCLPARRRPEQCRSAECAYLLEDVRGLQAAYALPLFYQPARRRSRGATKCRKSLRARSLSVVSEAREGKACSERGVCALSIQRLEGSRPRLRRVRALWKLCRTAMLGGHLEDCTRCGDVQRDGGRWW
jgi:hypothetical protein